MIGQSGPIRRSFDHPLRKTAYILKLFPCVVLVLDTPLGICYHPHSLSGSNSVVECNLAKVDVAGSNPVSRSIFLF